MNKTTKIADILWMGLDQIYQIMYAEVAFSDGYFFLAWQLHKCKDSKQKFITKSDQPA